jgi:hypothetical protein
MTLRTTQPLTEIEYQDSSRGRGRPEHNADNLTAICEPIV